MLFLLNFYINHLKNKLLNFVNPGDRKMTDTTNTTPKKSTILKLKVPQRPITPIEPTPTAVTDTPKNTIIKIKRKLNTSDTSDTSDLKTTNLKKPMIYGWRENRMKHLNYL